MGTGSLIPIMIIDDHSRYCTHENNKKDQMAAADEMGGCLKNAMTDCYLNNTVTKEAYISNIQSYFSQAAHKLTFEPDMEVTLVNQYGRPWNVQSNVPFTSEPAVSLTTTEEPKTISEPAVFMTTTEAKTTSANRIAAPVGFVADIIDSGQGKAVSIAFQEVAEAVGYKLYVDGTYMRDIPTAVNIPTAEFVPGNHTFAVTAFDAASESIKTPAVTLLIEPKVEPTAPEPTTPASTAPALTTEAKVEPTAPEPTTPVLTTPSPTTKPTVEETLPDPESYSSNGPETVDALTIGANFILGIWDALKSMGEGISNTVFHPIKTIQEIGSVIGYTGAHPLEAGKSIWESVSSSVNRNVIHGNGNTRSHFLGRIIGEVALAKGVAKVVKGIKRIKGAGKIISKADDVTFNGSSVDKAFAKHGKDFGKYPDGGKTSVNAFTNDVKNLINNGTQVKGTYRTTAGTHIYNPSTKQWVFINADGTFNTAFKLSDSQYKYLIETGVIK